MLFDVTRRFDAPHDPARAILDHVLKTPGVGHDEVAEGTKIHKSSVRYHLERLVEQGRLVRQKVFGFTRYYPPGAADFRDTHVRLALRTESARRFLAAVCAQPGGSLKEGAERSRLAMSMASYYLRRLGDAGLVRVERAGSALKIHPTPLGRQASTEHPSQ